MGKIVEILDYFDDYDFVVYIDTGDGITGIEISKCQGFIPKVGDEVEIDEDTWVVTKK